MDRFENTRQPDWDWWGRLWPTPGATLRRLGVEPDASLVEIGSGNGYFALPAARITDPAPVYAVDLDEDLLDELETLAALQDVENVAPIAGDARDLPTLLPERADLALLANAFHGIDDSDAFVRAVHECLAAEGRFVVVNWADRPRAETTIAGAERGPPTDLRIGPSATSEAVTAAASFEEVERMDLPPYHYGLVFERA